MNTRKVGAAGENAAADFLSEHGVKIIERNFRCRAGEIDIIGTDEGYLVFFEVKYRKGLTNGRPEEAVNAAKQEKICRVADYYMMVRKVGPFQSVRYDVLAIEGLEVRWIKGAFEHIYRHSHR